MTEPEILPAERSEYRPGEGMIKLTHLIYALHALSVITGVATSATIVGSFVGGIPSIIAVILNYVKRGEVRGSWLDSHFSWQIRTFWYAAMWIVVAYLMFITIIGIPFFFVIVALAGLWVMYRVVRGWLALNDRRAMPE
ncbi:MAG: hypothetical protein KF909_11630 [Rhodocyclaceae bacterium]|nr:hypothetical protein [Rhodocyclaceae bacterium]MCP5233489.1 hypothetical protein [Zoogloeaceae bacterium]MCB1913784.1 hypothetical protein [Rhodocyclaceae bacterium]MCP5241762.1 hypothetical protein [Zoogloeaceae bacterium]MCP5256187.1 hypothetical protein [Zoogloeaceae bacterium]